VSDLPHIVWPALGFPAIAEDIRAEITVIVSAPAVPMGAEAWLKPAAGTTEWIPLQAIAVEESSYDRLHIGRWAPWVRKRWPRIFAISYRIPLKLFNDVSRTGVADLRMRVNDSDCLRPGAVCLRRSFAKTFRVAAASDIHVATRWDTVAREARIVFEPRGPNLDSALWSRESFENSFLNPNDNFVELIRQVNAEATNGGLDALLLVGDLVDFKYHRDGAERGVEWSLLERLIAGERGERLRVPLFTSTGNHDYRLYPYKFQIYGLNHCGLDETFTTEYLRRTQRVVTPKYSFSDFGSISINRGRSHSLDSYYTDFNPCDDYAIDIAGVRVIMLDTGPDVFCDISEAVGRRWNRYIANLGKIEDPNSASLSDRQITFLRATIAAAGEETPVLIGCHAPPLNPPKEARANFVDRTLLRGLEAEGSFARAVAFERQLSEQHLDCGIFFKNHYDFFHTLGRHRGDVAVISGHNHWRMSGSVDKTSGADGRIDLWQMPSCGHINRQDLRHGTPGFVIVEHNGEFSRRDHHVPTNAFRHWLYEWDNRGEAGGMRRISVHCEPRETHGATRHRLYGFVSGGARPAISSESPGVEIASLNDSAFAMTSYANDWTFDISGLAQGSRITLLFESFDAEGPEHSYGLHRHHREIQAE